MAQTSMCNMLCGVLRQFGRPGCLASAWLPGCGCPVVALALSGDVPPL